VALSPDTSNTSFDVIVTGVGSMGSSACYYLAKRGYRVLGLEQFDITHERGSHAGQSRIIRKAYFEHPDYVPLLQGAYKNWQELESETGEQLYFPTGLVYFGNRDNEMMKGIKSSAKQFNIPLENPTIKKRFYQFDIPGDFETLFEPEAGFVTPEKAIKLYIEQAISKGAEIHTREKVIEWTKDSNSIIVTTNKNTYHCNKLIISAGAWSGKILPDFEQTIKVTRQSIAWIKPKKWDDFLLNNFPCWMIADNEMPGCYYGFPVLPIEKFGEPYGLKIAYHYPGTLTDPDNLNNQPTEKDLDNLLYAMEKYFPGVFESFIITKSCLYSNTPDENFIIDKLPGFEEQVTIACGFSGHGFKFVPVVGEILADISIKGKTKCSIDFLSLKRFV
jgi:sarcosine oxidase